MYKKFKSQANFASTLGFFLEKSLQKIENKVLRQFGQIFSMMSTIGYQQNAKLKKMKSANTLFVPIILKI